MQINKYDILTTITDTESLDAFCLHVMNHEKSGFITVDTEFMRRTTYWSQLCLIQIASSDQVVMIDPLAKGIDLSSFYKLMTFEKIVKVLHSSRQDVEIFYHASGSIPAPLFDTQVAAMVCGYGDSIGYGNLVEELLNISLDKTQRFTDWARRPLKQEQLYYAMQDVTHLRKVYDILVKKLEKEGRETWIAKEMKILNDPKTYDIHFMDIWQRIKTRSDQPRFLARMQYLAAARERYAIQMDKPRTHVASDLSLLELAADPPASIDLLRSNRSLSANKEFAEMLFQALQEADTVPDELCPRRERRKHIANPLLIDVLKIWLKQVADDNKVSQKLIASPEEIEQFVNDREAKSPILEGWKFKIFGATALAIARGEKSIRYVKNKIVLED